MGIYRGLLQMQMSRVYRQLFVAAEDAHLATAIFYFYFSLSDRYNDPLLIVGVDVKGRAEDGGADGAGVYDKGAGGAVDIEKGFTMQGYLAAMGSEAGAEVELSVLM